MPTTLDGGWYVVTEDVEYSDGIDIIGDVNLILADGANMDINSNGVGICISYDKILTIYGQASGSGSINITSDEDAIVVGSEGGSYSGVFPCCFTVNGGNVIANSRITVYSSYYGDGRLTLGGGTLSASGYSVPGNIIYITDGWIYTDGTDFFDTGSISTPPGAATYRPKWWDGNGTSDDPYLIKTTADLDQLATRVNSYFSDYSGTYFKLDNDITYTHKADNEEGADTENNYTAIGGYFGGNIRYFSGHFDGGGHTISGIRIYQDNKDYQGLFGYIENGEVKNVILADTRITGKCYVGGIAGLVGIINEENGGTVENCHVLSNVTVHAVGSNASDHGGIAGANWGTVTGCTSAAAVTPAEGISSSYYGGIVGDNNGPISDCIYLGSNLGGSYLVGAIAGANDDDGNVSNCYFTSTTITGKNYDGLDLDNTNSAVGENDATVETNVGLAPQDTKDNSGFLTLMAARNAALTAVERTTPLSTAINVTLNGRTLYKDGAWNTLCLPFSIDDINAKDASDNYICPLHGATVKTLVSSSFSGGTLSMNFTEDKDNLTAIQAGVPYIVKWTPVDGYVNDDAHNIVNPVFTDVIVSNTTANVSTDCVDFVGTYSPTDIYTADKTNLYLGGGNTLYYPWADGMEHYYVKANRAYFQLKNELTAGDPASGVRAFNLNFGDGEASGITTTNYTNLTNYSDAWYTVNGVKLDGKPTKAGLYINNGRKIVIK